MKAWSIVLVALLFSLAGCGSSVRDAVDADARVSSFIELFPEAEYVEGEFAGNELGTIRDVFRQECANVTLPDPVVRAAYVSEPATAVAYVDENDTVICVATKLNQDAFEIEKGDPSTVAEGTLVTVNGEPITVGSFEAAAAALSPEVRNQTTPDMLLNRIVDEMLLRQEAESVAVEDADVATAAERAWRDAGYADRASFEQALASQGATYDSFLGLVREQLKVERLLAQEGITAINISPDAAEEFYLSNPNSFLVSEQVRFRQLFVSLNASGSAARAESRLRAALDALQEDDFCAVVRRMSDDIGSRDSCGEYIAPRGVLLPELEAAVFSLGVNGSTVAQSANGYHVIVVLAHQPTSVIPYAQARDQVVGLLQNAAVEQRLGIYLLKLRAKAEIVDYT